MPTDAFDRRQPRPKQTARQKRQARRRTQAPAHAAQHVAARTETPTHRRARARADAKRARQGGAILARGSFLGPKTKLQKAAAPKAQRAAEARARRRDRLKDESRDATSREQMSRTLSAAQLYPSKTTKPVSSRIHPSGHAAPLVGKHGKPTRLSRKAELNRRRLHAAGLPVPGVGGPNLLGNAFTDLAQATIATPGAIYHGFDAQYRDVRDTLHGHPTLRHSRKYLKDYGEGVVKSTWETTKDPFGHPLFFAANLSGAGGAVGGALLRGEAGAAALGATRAAGERGAVRAAVKAAAKRPVAPVRMVRYRGLHEPALDSEHPVAMFAQRIASRRRKGRVQEVKPKRMNRELTQNQRLRHEQDTADARALEVAGHRATIAELIAHRSVLENTHPSVRVKNEVERARNAKNPLERRRHMRKARQYRAASRYVTTDAAGDVVIDPKVATAWRLRDVTRRLRHGRLRPMNAAERQAIIPHAIRVEGKQTAALEDAGVLHPAQAEFRRHVPGRLERGESILTFPERQALRDQAEHDATILNETRGHLHNLLEHHEELRRELELAREEEKAAGVPVHRPRTEQEARRRLAELDKWYEERLADFGGRPKKASLADNLNTPQERLDYKRLQDKKKRDGLSEEEEAHFTELKRTARGNMGRQVGRDSGWRNKANKKRAKKAPGQRPIPSAKEEDRARLEEAFNQIVDAHRGSASTDYVKELVAKTDERSALRDEINRLEAETVFGGTASRPGEFGTVRVRPGSPHPDRPGELVPHPGAAREVSRAIKASLRATRTERRLAEREHLRAFKRATKTAEKVEEEPTFHGGKARVPSRATRVAKAVYVQPQRAGRMAPFVRDLPQLRHRWRGSLRERGLEREDTTRLISENFHEASRYLRALSNRERLLKAAVKRQEEAGPGAVAIRPETLRGKSIPTEVKVALEKEEAGVPLSTEEKALLGRELSRDDYRQLGQSLFPDSASVSGEHGIMWVNKHVADGLIPESVRSANTARAALGHVATGADLLNDAVKASVLYLKPAYLTPNLLGQGALILTRQGFLAPLNLARAVRIVHRFGPEDSTIIRSVMQDGIVNVLRGERLRVPGVQALARGYERILDTPFRDASFIHEARRRGFKTAEEVHDLLHNPAHEAERLLIARRANEAMIDYGRLSPTERAVAGRVIFFYPWLKGSARYAKWYVKEHPIQAQVYAQLGRVQQQRNEQELGELGHGLSGLFKVGERNVPGFGKLPLVSNPAAATILGQPAQVTTDLIDFAHGEGDITRYLTPAWATLVAEVTHTDPFTGNQIPENERGPLHVFLKQLLGGSPQLALIQHMRGHGTNDRPYNPEHTLFPYSPRDAINRFTFGSVAKAPLNATHAHQFVRDTKLNRMSVPDRHAYLAAQGIAQVEHTLPKVAPAWKPYKPYFKAAIALDHARAVADYRRKQELGLSTSDSFPKATALVERIRVNATALVGIKPEWAHLAGVPALKNRHDVDALVAWAQREVKAGRAPNASKLEKLLRKSPHPWGDHRKAALTVWREILEAEKLKPLWVG